MDTMQMEITQDQNTPLYDDKLARPECYSEKWNFDPLDYIRKSTDEEGRLELSLDIKYRKHWFRLVYPSGKFAIVEKDINERRAIIIVRVYADKADPDDQFLAEGTGIRYYSDNKPYERYYVDWARTAAIGNALTDAGFDVPWCNKPAGNGHVNAYTGETITYDDSPVSGPAPAAGPSPTYSDATAPPPQQTPQAPAVAAPAPKQAPPAPVHAPAQTPAMRQAAPAPAQTPAMQQAAPAPTQTPATQQATPAPAGRAQQAVGEDGLPAVTTEQALQRVVTFGINKGMTLGEIAQTKPADIDWIANKYRGNDKVTKACAKLLAESAMRQAG